MFKYCIIFILLLITACDLPAIYKVTGVIKEIDSSSNKLLIDHDKIPNFMDSMVMYFNIDNSTDTESLSINDSILFDFLVFKDKSKIINIKKLGISLDNSDEEWGDLIKLKTPGEKINDFIFLNTSNKEIKISDFSKDKFTIITFIFSKCPMPNMCPASIVKNQFLAKKFKNSNINFLMISFDYLYDTPIVLKNIYGNIETENLHFLSSTKNIQGIYELAEQSGVGFWGVEENNIGHTMRTIILDNNLKLIKTFDGTDWKPAEMMNYLNILIKGYN